MTMVAVTHGVPQRPVFGLLLLVLYKRPLQINATFLLMTQTYFIPINLWNTLTHLLEHLNFRVSGQKFNPTTTVKCLEIHLNNSLTQEMHFKNLQTKLTRQKHDVISRLLQSCTMSYGVVLTLKPRRMTTANRAVALLSKIMHCQPKSLP